MNHGILHFGKLRSIEAKEIGQPEDSGNGYYSYSYYILPFTGKIEGDALQKINQILHKRHYRYPFTSLGSGLKVFSQSNTGGELLYSVTYHHGD